MSLVLNAEVAAENGVNGENGFNGERGDCVSGETEHDPQYEPIVSLPLVTVSTNEEDEVELCKIRARLYRFDKVDHEWKERGTGDIKLLHHLENNTVRVVMRRDKTLKICANHFVTDDLQLNPHIGSDRAFNWTTFGDFADETAKQEFLAIKFGNVENATIWKTKFLEAQEIVKTKCKLYNGDLSNESVSDQSDNESEPDKTTDSAELKKAETDNEEISKKENSNDDEGVVLKLSELTVKNESKEADTKE